MGQNENQKNIEPYKYNTQLLIEMELLVQIIKKYLNDKLVEKGNICKNIIFGFLAKIKGLRGNNEKEILTNDEIKMKNNMINGFMQNYDSFYKIFN